MRASVGGGRERIIERIVEDNEVEDVLKDDPVAARRG